MHAPEEATPPLLVVEGAVATIRLNRPREHNRLDPADIGVLLAHFDAVEANEALRVLVLTGSGDRTFCSGYTLTALRDMEVGAGGEAAPTLERMIDRLEALRLPTVCALNGSVYGGGTDLALACDFRVGVTGSRLVMPAAKIGLHYYASGMRRFVERLGPAAAKRLFLLGEAVDAGQLLAMGYLTELVAPSELAARSAALAATLAGNAPVIQGMKRHVNRIARGDYDPAAITAASAASVASEDLVEGLAAMRDKRRPVFRGR